MTKNRQVRLYRLFQLPIIISLLFSSLFIPLILTPILAVEDVTELNERGGIVDVRVGPTPRYGSIVLGLVYINISEESLGEDQA